MTEQQTIPCRLCGAPTPMLGMHLCDRCWELERQTQMPNAKQQEILELMRDFSRAMLFANVFGEISGFNAPEKNLKAIARKLLKALKIPDTEENIVIVLGDF